MSGTDGGSDLRGRKNEVMEDKQDITKGVR